MWYNVNHEPISISEADELLKDMKARHVAVTAISDTVHVSTVFLVLDHGIGRRTEAPILYETMVFGGPHSEARYSYATREAALAGHDRMVAWLRDPHPADQP